VEQVTLPLHEKKDMHMRQEGQAEKEKDLGVVMSLTEASLSPTLEFGNHVWTYRRKAWGL